jgi:cyclase
MNRRSFLTRLAPAAFAAAYLNPRRSWAIDVQRSQLTVTDVADRMFVISGGGGNVTVFNSTEGVLLVDGGSPERSAEVLKLIKQRTGTGRVHTLINTHWHWDQTGSNLALGRSGTRIIAHENTRLWLATDVDSKWQHRVFKRLPPKARPNETFYTTGSLSFGDQTLDYGYLPQAHTDGDIYVHFKECNILVAGDVLSVGAYPVIDYCTNGWIGGMVNATQTLRSICNSSTRVIPGLGPPQAPAALDAEHDMLAALKLTLAKLLAQGMSAKDMLDSGATREFDAQWGDPTLFVRNVWPGLVERARELGVSIV